MLASILQQLTAHVHAMHRDQGGAVALMCMAALIILFMMSMVIIDSGMVAREKIQTQIAADTAAYGHAAVRARAANMVAFNNVAKRSIVGLHTVYHSAWIAYVAWYMSHVARCFKKWPNLSSCRKVFKNFMTVIRESMGDWAKISGDPSPAFLKAIPKPIIFGGDTKKKYSKEMEQITKYQNYILKLAPWWAYAEASVRGSRNGSHITVSWPPPKGLTRGVTGFIQTVTSILQSFGLFRKTGREDTMETNLYKYKKRVLGIVPAICEATGSWNMVSDPAFGVEMMANTAIQASRSKKDAPKFAGTWIVAGSAACAAAHLLGFKTNDTGYFEPKSYSDRKQRSGVIMSYRNAPLNAGRYKENFAVANAWSDYQTSQNAVIPDHSSGPWALAGNEIVQIGDKDPWHTNWTGRMRPIQADRRYTVDLNAAYHDLLPFMSVQLLMGMVSGIDTSSAIKDFIAFEKATRVLDTRTKDGLVK